MLHLEGSEKAKAAMSPTDIEVMQGNRLYVFSLKQAEWSHGVDVYVPPSPAAPKDAEPVGAEEPSP